MYKSLFISIVFILVGCNHSNSLSTKNESNFQPQNVSFKENQSDLDLTNTTDSSTTEPQTQETNTPTELELPQNLGFGVPSEKPAEQQELKQETEINSAQLQEDGEIPFQNFKERWNAISAEQGPDLMISSFTKEGTYYRSILKNNLELRVFITNQKVTSLEMIGLPNTKADILSMITGWSQIYYILDPDYEPYHADTLLATLGVGPNSNLNELTEQSVIHDGIQYKVTKTENGYVFHASYQ